MTQRITKAVFPAAGFGTRFLPVTKALPKEMLPIVDTPVIQLLAEEAAASGIEDIILITGRGKRAIEDHFDTSYELEQTLVENGKHDLLESVERIPKIANFVYVRQPRPRGNGDAVLRAKHLIGDEPFAVLYGDDIVDHPTPAIAQMIAAYQERPGIYLAVREVPLEEVSSYGVIDPGEQFGRTIVVRGVVEKPAPDATPSRYAIIGKYLLIPEIFAALDEVANTTGVGKDGKELNLMDGLDLLLSRGTPIYAYAVEGTRYDTGSKLGFLQATVAYALKNPSLREPFRTFLQDLLARS